MRRTTAIDRQQRNVHDRHSMKRPDDFRGNKEALASKPCAACGRTMTWRRKWANDWQDVRYCSDACRRTKRR